MVIRPELIRRGARFTGRILRDAIRIAARAPLGGQGITVSSSAQLATIRRTGHQIIGQTMFPCLITASLLIGTNRWEYSWLEAIYDPVSEMYVPKPNGRSGTVRTPTAARNRVENANDGVGQEGYGVTVDNLNNFEIILLPINIGSVVLMMAEKDTQGGIAFRFQASNDVDVVCL